MNGVMVLLLLYGITRVTAKTCDVGTVANALLRQRQRDRSMLWILANLPNAPWSNFANTSDAIGYFYNYYIQAQTPFDETTIKGNCRYSWSLAAQGVGWNTNGGYIPAATWQKNANLASYKQALKTAIYEMANILGCNAISSNVSSVIQLAVNLISPTIYAPNDLLCVSDASMWSIPNLVYQSYNMWFQNFLGAPVMFRQYSNLVLEFVYAYGSKYWGNTEWAVFDQGNREVLDIVLLQMITKEQQVASFDNSKELPRPEGLKRSLAIADSDEKGRQIGLIASVLTIYFVEVYTDANSSVPKLQNKNVSLSYNLLKNIFDKPSALFKENSRTMDNLPDYTTWLSSNDSTNTLPTYNSLGPNVFIGMLKNYDSFANGIFNVQDTSAGTGFNSTSVAEADTRILNVLKSGILASKNGTIFGPVGLTVGITAFAAIYEYNTWKQRLNWCNANPGYCNNNPNTYPVK